MARTPMSEEVFEQLLSTIVHETTSLNRKLDVLHRSHGCFSAYQASRMLYSFEGPSDKLKALCIMTPRLCPMTCCAARDVIGTVNIENDKIRVLESIKMYLLDAQLPEGMEQILGAFIFEDNKQRAFNILHSVQSNIPNVLPAGGHQGYGACGGLYAQSAPLLPHMYGSLSEQRKKLPGGGNIEVPVTAKAALKTPRSTFGLSSNTAANGCTYGYGNPSGAWDASEMQGTGKECPARPPVSGIYPLGAPLLGFHQDAPAPTGFQV